MKPIVPRVLLLTAGLLLCALAACAQQPTGPAPAKRSLPPIPGLGPEPVLPANPTAAQQAEHKRQMAERTRIRWNYLLTDSLARARTLNEKPNALLVETAKGLPPGTALDADMGEGRNAIYLAQQGWRVTGVDIAEKALAYAQARARKLGVPLTTEVADMATYDWGTNKWDLIVLSYAGGRDYAARVMRALKPGGLVVLEAFHMDATKRVQVVGGDYRVFFNTDELPKLYAAAGLTIVRYEEPIGTADFTKEQLRLVKMVARKP
ncbi:methyltransferase domain-containing protein [Hymenobacter sp. 5317J-9]|uniref:class I SAM-dependent methyltransferase n=1 Tax=Hymenobacter sp. 5317J-9 TaxID=2932250 RepID=UPI001FD6CF3E|nr:class I SAM-dependent methyltransferase [Hymenobacter sp. 5317J-9]UOQ98908.1 methyltransferase domain-containing protein [Hymenobacter sp. 5317J-9]